MGYIPPLKLEERERARTLFQEGHNYTNVAKQVGVSRSSVANWCRDLVEVRPDRPKISAEDRIPLTMRPMAEEPYADYYLCMDENKDGIQRVRLVHKETKARLTLAMARYVMAVHLKRPLLPTETVRHKKGPSNEISNLRIMTDDTKGQRPVYHHKCEICDAAFTSPKKRSRTCSKVCKNALVSSIMQGRSTVFHHVCDICEEPFESRSGKTEVCFSPACRDIVKAVNKRDKAILNL